MRQPLKGLVYVISDCTVNCFSKTGRYHTSCEDVYLSLDEGKFQLYGLADGQSSKRLCTVGGRAALEAVAQYIKEKSLTHLSHYAYLDEIRYEIIRVIRNTLSELSRQYDAELSEFSSTLLIMAIDTVTNNYFTIHLGDGAILAVTDNECIMLSEPENGITSRYTWLTTSCNAMHHIRLYSGSVKDLGLRRIVLLTDGATMLCRGRNIAKKAEPILCDMTSPNRIMEEIEKGDPTDDASCIVVDLPVI